MILDDGMMLEVFFEIYCEYFGSEMRSIHPS